MGFLESLEIYLQEIMRNVAAALMAPVMIVLVGLILFSVYSVGALIAEFIMERRHFKANMPRDIKSIKDSSFEDLPKVIESTGLLRKQKTALQVIAANMGLPEDDLFALAKSEVSATDARYRKKVSRTELVTKIAPMMGLMCTLIPLGPGIVAMGQGEVNILSNSLLIAFDGTVAGLIGGVVSMCVGSVRKRWYSQYLVAMEALTTCVLEKASEARKAGIELPYEGDVRARAEAFRAGATNKTGLKPAEGKLKIGKSAKKDKVPSLDLAELERQESQEAQPVQQVAVAQPSWESRSAQSTPIIQSSQETSPVQQAPVSQFYRETQLVQQVPVAQPSWETKSAQQIPVVKLSQEMQPTQQVPAAQLAWEAQPVQPASEIPSSWGVQPAQQVPTAQLSREAQPVQQVPAVQPSREAQPVQQVPTAQPSRKRQPDQSSPLAQSGWGMRL